MFYYPEVLQHQSGCFSTIWLAATKGIRITRREVLKVNVIRTCEDIIEYVLVKVPPVHPSLPRPRFSLYLSSQLHYGVVIVYHRQCGFLLEEAQQTIERLLRSSKHARIDMQEPDRLALNNPDPEALMEEAMEPFFGVMGSEPELPSPYQLAQSWRFLEVHTPERPPVKTPRRSQAEAPGHMVSPECITLRENELTALRMPEYGGAELVEPTAQEIDMLLRESDHLMEEAEEKEKEKEREAEREKTLETNTAMVSVEQLTETLEIGPPEENALGMMIMEVTPSHATCPTTREGSELDKGMMQEPSSSLHLEPQLDVPLPKRGRRRQLLFADEHTQISQSAMEDQIHDPLVETVAMSDVLLTIPSSSRLSVEELVSAPCGALLHPDLLSLWNQCAVLTTRPGRRRARVEERERGQERSELSSELGPRVEERELERRNRDSSVQEDLREFMESGLHLSELSAVSDTQLDISKEDKALDPVSVPVGRWSVTEEAPSVLHMEPILEEPLVELPPTVTEMEPGEHTTASLLRAVSSHLERFGKISFDSMLPPEADRCTVVHVFYNLLVLVSERRLGVYQAKPFDPITVTAGLHIH
ncbi:REC8 meiotic recombination protein b isoform X2 [Alosa sapidissima]|uniref:REC8 meiotic recombination protein b isoform X2 n=1 Tax=Alosa sapidissima TaxID=34773 RepID=UPI001C0989BF|nr:REC8 meiotic recombination protein b isoform X2 [Alosa sapidissima]